MTQKGELGIFYVAMVSVAAGFSIRNLPSMAVVGWSLIFWYALATALFLLPLALVAAELAAAWPEAGGVFAWVREAFGDRTGFMAIWAIVVQNVPWYPTVLAFVAASIVYGFVPELQDNRWYAAGAMIAIFWLVTFACLAGPVTAAKFASIGTLAGNVVPAAVLIVAAIAWIAAHKPIALPAFTSAQLWPVWDGGTLPLVSSLLLAFTGLEMSGYFALQVRDPQRDFPRALGIALVGIASLSVLATLAIALVVPAEKISLSGGVVQTFAAMFAPLGVTWLVPILAILTAVGALALMGAWLIGPLMSMATIARSGLLPPVFRRLNGNQVPAAVLLWQGALITIVSIAYACVPSANAAYWVLTASSTALLGFYYLPIFAAVIRLRYTQPETLRPFRIPGGFPGVWLVGTTGFVATAFAVAIALERPSTVPYLSDWVYVGAMIVLALCWMLPFAVFTVIRKTAWRVTVG
jgi:glutamate:GABA antiporter